MFGFQVVWPVFKSPVVERVDELFGTVDGKLAWNYGVKSLMLMLVLNLEASGLEQRAVAAFI